MKRRTIFYVQLQSACGVGVLLIAINLDGMADAAFWIEVASILLLMELGWMLYSWAKIAGGIFNPYGLFVGMIAVTHGAVPLLSAIGIEPQYGYFAERWVRSIPQWAVADGYLLICLSCILLHMGAVYARREPGLFRTLDISGREIRRVGLLLIIASLIPSIFTLKSFLGNSEHIGYAAYFQSYKINTWLLNGSLFFPVGAYYLFVGGGTKIDKAKWLGALLVILYASLYLMVGSRNNFVFKLVTLFWLNQVLGKKVPTWMLLIGAGSLLILAPVIAVLRSAPGTGVEAAVSRFGGLEGMAVAALAQLGVYAHIVTTTVATFPAQMDFNGGRSYLNAVFFVIPNFFFPRGEHVGLDLGTVTWLVSRYFPEYVAKGEGFGLGFSFIAEAYESFGWLGPVIVMPVIGYLVGSLSNACRRDNLVALAFTAAILSSLLFYPRDSFYALARAVAWYGFIPVALIILLRVKWRGVGRQTEGAGEPF